MPETTHTSSCPDPAILDLLRLWRRGGNNRKPSCRRPCTPSADKGREWWPSDGAQLQVRKDSGLRNYATGFQTPRFMLTGTSGEIILSDSSATPVYVLVDKKTRSYKNPERKKSMDGAHAALRSRDWTIHILTWRAEPSSAISPTQSDEQRPRPGRALAEEFNQSHGRAACS